MCCSRKCESACMIRSQWAKLEGTADLRDFTLEDCSMTNSAFWRYYLVASVCSSLLSLVLFHWLDLTLREPYEASAIVAGLLTLPINWLVGEQLTWGRCRNNRWVRAGHYYAVYGGGLFLDACIVHLLGHVALWDGRLADLIGICVAMLWTAPMNRYVTWRAEFAPARARVFHP